MSRTYRSVSEQRKSSVNIYRRNIAGQLSSFDIGDPARASLAMAYRRKNRICHRQRLHAIRIEKRISVRRGRRSLSLETRSLVRDHDLDFALPTDMDAPLGRSR